MRLAGGIPFPSIAELMKHQAPQPTLSPAAGICCYCQDHSYCSAWTLSNCRYPLPPYSGLQQLTEPMSLDPRLTASASIFCSGYACYDSQHLPMMNLECLLVFAAIRPSTVASVRVFPSALSAHVQTMQLY